MKGYSTAWRRAWFSRILLLSLLLCAATASANDIVFILSKQSTPYRNFVESAIRVLDASGQNPDYQVYTLGDNNKLNIESKPRLVVSVGARATEYAIDHLAGSEIVSSLIPSMLFHQIVEERKKLDTSRLSVIYLDHPLQRNLNLIRIIQPRWKRVGLVLSQENTSLLQDARVMKKQGKFRLKFRTIADRNEVIASVNEVIETSDVLLTPADPNVLNSSTAQGILLSAYMKKVPVISYLKSYVNAGALAAVYTTPADLGRQTGEKVVSMVRNNYHHVASEEFPKYFSVSINQRVAYSLGIQELDEKQVLNSMREMEPGS